MSRARNRRSATETETLSRRSIPSRPTIAVDFDGVLCHGSGRYSERRPDLNQIQLVNGLEALGWRVVIWTSREETFSGRRDSEVWLRKHGVRFSALVMGKPIFDAVIDDRALPELPLDLSEFGRLAFSPLRFRTLTAGEIEIGDDRPADDSEEPAE